jgi:hypothetical protein
VTGGTGDVDHFRFAAGDASSLTEGAIDRITDFTSGTDKLSIGVGGAVETLVAAATFGAGLSAASGVITAGTSNLVVVTVGTVTYLFADTNDDNVIDTAVSFTGANVAIATGDFLV